MVTFEGNTALHVAAYYDQVCIVTYCLEQKLYLLDSRAISRELPKNNEGLTPLDVAAKQGSVNCAQFIVGKMAAKAEMRYWEKVKCK